MIVLPLFTPFIVAVLFENPTFFCFKSMKDPTKRCLMETNTLTHFAANLTKIFAYQ